MEELRVKTIMSSEKSMSPSISIMLSKKEIVDIENAIESYGQNKKDSEIQGVRNRQITTGLIVDWKQFEEKGIVKSQLVAKDGQKGQKTIFSYVIEEWNKKQPSKVIYRWVRTISKNSQPSAQLAVLVEEQHIYRGCLKNYHKHGQGTYIINRKYSDNTEQLKRIKGEWYQDILRKGTLTDEVGKEQIITSNLLRMSMQSKKTIHRYVEKNSLIQELKKKTNGAIPGESNPIITSMASIKEKLRIR